MSAHDNGSNGAALSTADIVELREMAQRADRRASEALHRVHLVQREAEGNHANMGDSLEEARRWVASLEERLTARLDTLETAQESRHAAVSNHLEKIWGHLLTLETRGSRTSRDLVLLGGLVAILVCVLWRVP
jgi:chromosome segregation ATPase